MASNTRRGSKPKDPSGLDSTVPSPQRSNPTLTFDAIKDLIQRSEEKILSMLDDITGRISALELKLDSVHSEQITQAHDIVKLKETVVRQQVMIESLEVTRRQNSLIISNVPESDIQFNGGKVATDDEKVHLLCSASDESFDSSTISLCSRLGRPDKNRKRPIKVDFTSTHVRNKILRSQRRVRQDASILKAFGPVYLNPDRSHLARLEDKRLREKMKRMKSNSSTPDEIYIRSGKLYRKSDIVDQVDIGSHLLYAWQQS